MTPRPPAPAAAPACPRARGGSCATRSSTPPSACCSRPARRAPCRSAAVADAVGVTPPSIYRHFADKTALIFEVVARHFTSLENHVRQACEGIDDPVDRLAALGVAYIEFGIANPEPYRIMFMTAPDVVPARVPRPGAGRLGGVRAARGLRAGGHRLRPAAPRVRRGLPDVARPVGPRPRPHVPVGHQARPAVARRAGVRAPVRRDLPARHRGRTPRASARPADAAAAPAPVAGR